MHTIRLREPWEVEAGPGCVIYRRHFNRPTGLGPGDVVRLAIDELRSGASVSFNGQPLTVDGAQAWDIGIQLQSRNVIVIEIGATAPQQHPFGDVRLEIS